MDISTILGIISGISLIFIAIFLQSGLGIFISIPSVLIVVGGTLAATLISYPMDEVIGVMKIASKVFRTNIKEPTIHMIELVNLSSSAKRTPLIHLPRLAKSLNDPFLIKGTQMVADGIQRNEIIRVLDTEIMITLARHRLGREIFRAMARFSPAFGLVGTLIGLVQMLTRLDDPSQVGSGMAVALLTTFYGVLLSNMIFTPIANKLKRRSEQEFLLMQISKEAILSIQAKEPTILMEDKLSSFISHSLYTMFKEMSDRKPGVSFDGSSRN